MIKMIREPLPVSLKPFAPSVPVKIKRLRPDVPIPSYATEGSAGFDIAAAEDVIIEPGETALVPTGLAVELPANYELQIRPRSGISLKTKLRIANAPGMIDSDFRGEVSVIVDNMSYVDDIGYSDVYAYTDGTYSEELGGEVCEPNYDAPLIEYNATYIIRKGDRIAQGIISPVYRANFVEVEELTETERGDGGFGSTGTKTKEAGE